MWLFCLVILQNIFAADSFDGPYIQSIDVYSLHTNQVQYRSQINKWAPMESDSESKFRQLLVNIRYGCYSGDECGDSILEIKQPYQVRKATLSPEESSQLTQLEDARDSLIGKYLQICCYTEDDYLAMLYKMSQEERAQIEILLAKIQEINDKDQMLLSQGMKTLYHLEKTVEVGQYSWILDGHEQSHWVLIDNLSCGEFKITAKFAASSRWTEKTFNLECPDYSH